MVIIRTIFKIFKKIGRAVGKVLDHIRKVSGKEKKKKRFGCLGTFMIILAVLILFLAVAWNFLFGWVKDLMQGLKDFFTGGKTGKCVTTDYNYQGIAKQVYYTLSTYEKDGVRYIIEYDEDDNVVKEMTFDEYVQRGSNLKKILDCDQVNIVDNGTLLLADEDIEQMFKRIIMDEKQKELHEDVQYSYIEKKYLYSRDEYLPPEEPGGEAIHVQENPMWMPSDVWDPDDVSQWYTNYDFVELRANGPEDFRSETNPDGTDRYIIRWHLLLSVLEMASTHNYSEWGDSEEDESDIPAPHYGDTDGYYLENGYIDRLVDELSYEFSFYWDGTKVNKGLFDSGIMRYEDMEKYCFRVEVQEMKNVPEIGDIAYVKKIPATAPKRVENIFETIEYNYEPVEDEYGGAYILKDRTVKMDVRPFYNLCMEITDGFFTWQYLKDIVSTLPGHEATLEQVEYLEWVHGKNLEYHGPYVVKPHEEIPGLSGEVRVGKECAENLEETDPGWDPGEGGYIDGDFEFVYILGGIGDYPKAPGWHGISVGARADLTAGDNLSVDEIGVLLDYLEQQMGGPPEGVEHMRDAAWDIWVWQETRGQGSVSAQFAMWLIEAPWISGSSRGESHALKHWNFGNHKPGEGDASFVGSQGKLWKDYRAMYSDFGEAIVANIEFSSNKYWHVRGQKTFYSMSLWTPWGPYSAQTPEDAHNTFTNCYCPYFDDPSFETTPEKLPNVWYKGWSNNCGLKRLTVLGLVGKTIGEDGLVKNI